MGGGDGGAPAAAPAERLVSSPGAMEATMLAARSRSSLGSLASTDSELPSDDPFAALFAGFSIPMKLSKFKLNITGREIIEIGAFTMIQKKSSSKVFLMLCTDVALLCQMIDDDCYELMFMPVQRNKVKAKICKAGSLGAGVVAMKVKMGKSVVLKCKDEVERSGWIGKLNAPIGFIPTKALG